MAQTLYIRKAIEASKAGLNAIIKTSANGRTITVELVSAFGIRAVKHAGTATCHPNDTFNSSVGAAIAIHRAMGHPVPENLIHATCQPVATTGAAQIREATQATRAPQAPQGQPISADIETVLAEFDFDAKKIAASLITLRRYVTNSLRGR